MQENHYECVFCNFQQTNITTCIIKNSNKDDICVSLGIIAIANPVTVLSAKLE